MSRWFCRPSLYSESESTPVYYGNPVERSYDRFCEKYGGKKHVLKDSIKDAKGNYRDDIIYEIVTENK